MCALVFTQTIQAFLFAIIMTVIISTYIAEGGSKNILDPADTISATGVIAIVALTSISKVEALVKKIFGLNSSIADQAMKPPHGLGASLMALQLGKRVLDNVGKVGHGIAEGIGAGRDKKKAATRYARNLAVLNNKAGGASKPSASALPKDENGGENFDSGMALPNTGNSNSIGQGSDSLDNILNSGHSATRKASTARKEVDAMLAGKKASNIDQEKLLKIQEKLEDDLAAAKKRRRGAWKSGISGVIETGGAAAGLVAGGSLGLVGTLATGDTPAHAIKAAVSGMGIGDAAGEKVVNTVAKGYEFAKDGSSVNKAYDAALSEAEKSLGMQQQTARRNKARLNNIQKQVRTMQEMNNNRDAGSI